MVYRDSNDRHRLIYDYDDTGNDHSDHDDYMGY